jgi:phthalate 4,5-dioxygenase oxygenase subunit
MLSKENNELVTRVGPGTPMGNLMRAYWLPALLTRDLPINDGDVLRIRLLGEDLVAFRDTDGAIGILSEHCAHRGVSLYFGRNEQCGLRCPYHGWKFDVKGACVDMPNEPAESKLPGLIRQRSYPAVEHGGLVWTYMGPAAEPPPLPAWEWLDLPDEMKYLSLRVQECNWLQALEGELDPSHGAILHGRVDGKGSGPDRLVSDTAPSLEVNETEVGVQVASRRDAGDDYYWRINQFVLPFYTIVPPGSTDPSGAPPDINGHAWLPMDDEHTLCVMFSYNPSSKMTEKRRALYHEGSRGREPGHLSVHGALPFDPRKPYGRYWPKWNSSNDYGFDRELQRTTYSSGMNGLWPQDAGVQESMGAIADRSIEHLCAADAGIARVRRHLRTAALAFSENGKLPPNVANPRASRLRSVGLLLRKDIPWREGAAEHMTSDGPVSYRMPKARLAGTAGSA